MSTAIIGLVGVVLGGIITTAGQFVFHGFEYKKWKKEQKIQYLKSQKETLEEQYKKYGEQLIEGMKTNIYDADMVTAFYIRMPQNVLDAFQKMMHNKDVDLETRKMDYWMILTEQKRSLVELDKQIEKEIDK